VEEGYGEGGWGVYCYLRGAGEYWNGGSVWWREWVGLGRLALGRCGSGRALGVLSGVWRMVVLM
jgi:hypothetical protein